MDDFSDSPAQDPTARATRRAPSHSFPTAEEDPFDDGDNNSDERPSAESRGKRARELGNEQEGPRQRRRRDSTVAIPRATPAESYGADYGAVNSVSPLVSGPARGMIPATGYKRKRSVLNKIGTFFGILFLLALLAVIILLGVLTITEYRPGETEDVSISHLASEEVEPGQQVSLLTWNIGYCGLSDEADYFMDGGTSVRSVSEEGVNDNLSQVESTLTEQGTDIMFLQEVDIDSDRSYHVDESQSISEKFSHDYCSAFGTNYMSPYIPYPIPPIGQVYAGIQTESRFAVDTATRISLPCPFSWPTRLGQLKRCMLVERIPVGDGAQQLVLVNVHLEAYDDGEGKAAQTAQMLRFLKREYEKGNYVIVGGDFNQTFSNVDTSAYPKQGDNLWQCGIIDASSFDENWQLLMDVTTPTCRSLDRPYDANDSNFQYYMIDGFICSPNVLVNELTTIDTGFDFSDHNPVKLVVTLSDEETVAADIAAKKAEEEAANGEGEETQEAEPVEEPAESEEKPQYVDEDQDGWDDITWEWIGFPDENGNYPDAESNNTEEWVE